MTPDNSTPPTPTQIATQAAEQFVSPWLHVSEEFKKQKTDQLAALILSAAAKMVQQSGAVEAIEKALGDCEAGQWSSVKDRFTTSTLNDVNAALQSLRSITGEAQ